MINVFSNKKTDGESEVFQLDADNNKRKTITNDRVFVVSGTFGGANVTVEISANGIDFVPLSNNSFTSASAKQESIPMEAFVRGTVSGSTGTTNINFHII